MDSNTLAALAYQEEQRRLAEQQQQNQGGLLDVLGKLALGAGAVAGGIAGVRYLRGAKPNVPSRRPPQPASTPNYEAVRRVASTQLQENPLVTRSQTPPSPGANSERIRRLEQLTREARSERMPGVIQTDLTSLVQKAGAPTQEFNVATKPLVVQSPQTGRSTQLPSTYFQRQPGSFKDITKFEEDLLGITAGRRLAQDPELLEAVRLQKIEEGGELGRESQRQSRIAKTNELLIDEEINAIRTQENTAQAAAQSDFASDYLYKQGYQDQPTLVDSQQSKNVLNSDQSLNAVYSGEDQQTGRIKAQLQRDHDLDISQVEILEDIAEAERQYMVENANPSEMIGYEADAPINQVASQLPNGVPVDQAELTAGAFAKKQMMQTRMSQLRAQLAEEGYRGLALEKELASRTNIKQASELYAATGDPNVLELAQASPSLPLAVKPKTNLQLGQSKTSFIDEEVPTSSYYEPFKERESESGGLVNADIYYTNRLSNLNAKLEGAPQFIDNPEYTDFIEQTNMAMSAMRQGDSTAAKIFARNKALLNAGKAPQPVIENPEHTMLQNQINYAEQARMQIRNKQNALSLQAERFPMVQKVVKTGEGSRLFAEVDPSTGELIPETIELRAGRPGLPGGTVSATATGRAIRGRVGAEGTTAGPTPGIFEPPAIVTEQIFKPETARYRGETSRGEYAAADAGKGLEYEAQPVRWDPDIHLPEQRTPEGFVYSEEAMLKPSQPLGRERTLGSPKSPRPVAQASVNLSEAVRKGEVQFPRQQTVQQSPIDAQKYFEIPSLFVKRQPQTAEARQLELPSDVVPSTAAAARVRLTPADLAAQQLESYMGKLQRGRSTPLTSQAVIQPRLF